MRWTKLGGFVASATILVPTVGSAHHSFAAHFEMDRFAEVEGRITAIEWINPHVLIYVEDAAGDVWEVEAGPVNLLSRMGIERDRFAVGDTIRARGNPGRRGARAQWVSNILLDDDTELLVGPNAEPYWTGEGIGDASFFFEEGTLGTVSERSFFRIWTPLVSGFPRPAAEPALTAAGIAAQAEYGIGNQAVADCEVPGMPRPLQTSHPEPALRGGLSTESCFRSSRQKDACRRPS